MTEPTLFDQTDAHARRSDPVSSHVTNRSLGKDTSLKALIWAHTRAWCSYHNQPMNDTLLTELLEHHTGRRFQRNVVARTRDLMTEGDDVLAPWFRKVGMADYQGRTIVHFIPITNQQGDQ